MAATITQELQDSFLPAIRKTRRSRSMRSRPGSRPPGTSPQGVLPPPSARRLLKAHDTVGSSFDFTEQVLPASGGSLTTCSRSPPRLPGGDGGSARACHRHTEGRRGQGGTSTANACQARARPGR
jgi:hypothetical protein